jgi:hypothetical protein
MTAGTYLGLVVSRIVPGLSSTERLGASPLGGGGGEGVAETSRPWFRQKVW